MYNLRHTVYLLILAALMAAGCTSSPWSPGKNESRSPAPFPPQTATAGVSANAAGRSNSVEDLAAVDAMMAEIDRMQVLDPAARAKVYNDLKQTEPHLRPLVLRQFRAALAYRQQIDQRGTAIAGEQPSSPEGSGRPEPPAGQTAMRPSAPGQPVMERPAETSQPGSPMRPVEATQYQVDPGRPALGNEIRFSDPLPASVVPDVTPDAVPRQTPTGAPAPTGRSPTSDRPAAGDSPEKTEYPSAAPPGGRASMQPPARIHTASFTPSPAPPGDWQEHLALAIRTMESKAPQTPQSADEMTQHARLRLLCLAADRREDALRSIPATAPSLQDVQDFWANEIYGLAVWLDAQRISDPSRRAEEAKRHLAKAVTRLAELSPLVVRNLAFVTDIQSFGSYRPCKKCEFAPEEALLLYAEVENLKSEETPKGFHTAWKSSYQIFDSRGQRVADHEPTPSEEYCQNPRHDFFIGCQFRLPKQIYPGKHTLQLTVEDLKSRKIGQSSIEFTVKQRD